MGEKFQSATFYVIQDDKSMLKVPEIIITNVSNSETEDVLKKTEIQKENSSLLWLEKNEKESAVEKSQGYLENVNIGNITEETKDTESKANETEDISNKNSINRTKNSEICETKSETKTEQLSSQILVHILPQQKLNTKF